MIAGLAKSIFGSSNDRYVAKLGKIVDAINGFEPTIAALSDEELANQTVLFRQRLDDGAKLDDLLTSRTARVLLYNTQAVDPVTAAVRATAEKSGVPVVTLTESLPAGVTSYLVWQGSQIDALARALDK